MATTLDKAKPRASRASQTVSDIPLLGKTRHTNLSVAALYEKAIERDEGLLAAAGPLVVRTGSHTGRSPKDKYIVDESNVHDNIWWGGFNRPITEDAYEKLRSRFIDHMNRARGLRPGRFRRGRPSVPPQSARLYRDCLGQHLLRQPVHPTDCG